MDLEDEQEPSLFPRSVYNDEVVSIVALSVTGRSTQVLRKSFTRVIHDSNLVVDIRCYRYFFTDMLDALRQ